MCVPDYRRGVQQVLPGLAVCVALAAVAVPLAAAVPGLGVVLWALLLGVVAGALLPLDDRAAPGVRYADHEVLGMAIALLGFGLDVPAVLSLGVIALPTLVVLVVLMVGLSVPLGRALGLSPTASVLLGVGQGICGTAAIAAAAPVLEAEEADTGVAVAVVSALGTVGILVLPPLTVALGLSDAGSALVLGGSLQAVGHAVAGGFAVSDPVGQLTTVVKLGRVALLPVVLLGLTAWRSEGGKGRAGLPSSLIGFLVAAGVAATGMVPAEVLASFSMAADALLAVAMAAIGTRIRLDVLRRQGTGSLIAGTALFGVQVLVAVLVAGWMA